MATAVIGYVFQTLKIVGRVPVERLPEVMKACWDAGNPIFA